MIINNNNNNNNNKRLFRVDINGPEKVCGCLKIECRRAGIAARCDLMLEFNEEALGCGADARHAREGARRTSRECSTRYVMFTF